MKRLTLLATSLLVLVLGLRFLPQPQALAQAVNHYVAATFHPSTTAAGLAVECTTLPSSPSNGAVACDSGASNVVKFYSNGAWVTAGSGTATTATLYLDACSMENNGAHPAHGWFAGTGTAVEPITVASGICGYKFYNATDNIAYLIFPNGYSSVSSVTVYVVNTGSASTGIAYMRTAVGCMAVDGSAATITYNSDSITSYNVSQISVFRGVGNYTVTSPDSTGCTNGKRMGIRFQRLGVTDTASDTTSIDMDVIGVKITLNL